ncbi:hypothetical protein WUBG_13270 [Wuchereria bancrofti]|uniref:Uncharacterized protein n=1 Tax=Wuchereria bancrofti TaxID=6293 RepID=J9EKD5_WUCBA|nr:hypothetical protein WUBG_13270 [Wuchereria bancrofti]
MDLKGDRSNVHYESLYKSDVAQYEFLLKKVLGGDEVLEKTMFPAYDRDSPPRHIAPPDEENDFSGRFGSFASRSKKKCENKGQQRCERQERKAKEKAKRKKELERERMLSRHSIKMVGINSDDESDIEVPLDFMSVVSIKQKRKLKHSSKEKKKKKRRGRSTSSSSSSKTSNSSRDSISSSLSEDKYNARLSVPQILCANHRWSFMIEFDPSNARSFMVMDLKGDRSNVHYESLYKSDVAQYEFLLKKVLGGDEVLEK